MSILIGFKRAKIQPLDKDGAADGDLIVLEGTQDKGATQEANISGLSAEPVKVYGSNIAYYISQKGTGDVAVDFKFLDVPSEAEDAMLGYKTDTTLKAQLIGEKTEAPYCAVLLESEDNRGNIAVFGFFKGKFNRTSIAIKTKEGTNATPEGESYAFAAVASDIEGKAKGNTMIKYLGTVADVEPVEKLVLRATGA